MAQPDGKSPEAHLAMKARMGRTAPTSLEVVAKLLPTPTSQADAGSRNLPGSKAHAGVSLSDAVRFGNSNTPRLLPTPLARDVKGGVMPASEEALSQSRGAGGASDLASVAMWQGKGRLLPTPLAHDARGPKSAAQVAAARERTGAGVSNLNEVVTSLLPTPRTSDAKGPGQHGSGGLDLRTAATLHGDSTPPPSSDGNPSSDDGHPTLWTTRGD